jgi:tetratricopeptide (TPR) repeat protein
LSRLGGEWGLSHAWDLVGYIHDCAGRSDQALDALRHAAAHAERSGVRSLVSYQRRTLLRSLAWGPGDVMEVTSRAYEMLEWAREQRDRYSEARALLTLAQTSAMTGRFEEARQYVRLQREICADVSLEFIDACGAFERAQVDALAGDTEAAEAEVREACEVLKRMGEKAVLPTLQVQLANILADQGRLDEAEAVVRAAKDLSASDDSLTEMKWRSVLAKVLADRGRRDEATALADEAAAIASRTRFLDWQAGVFVDIADALCALGRTADASHALAQASNLYGQKGNVVAQRAVEVRLHKLTA